MGHLVWPSLYIPSPFGFLTEGAQSNFWSTSPSGENCPITVPTSPRVLKKNFCPYSLLRVFRGYDFFKSTPATRWALKSVFTLLGNSCPGPCSLRHRRDPLEIGFSEIRGQKFRWAVKSKPLFFSGNFPPRVKCSGFSISRNHVSFAPRAGF